MKKLPHIRLKTKPSLPFCLWALAAIIVMALIFLASSQPAEESAELSGGLTELFFGTIWNLVAPYETPMPEQLFIGLETFLRKTAHFVIYFVLAFCVANAIRFLTSNRKRVFWITLIWGSAYGAIDEFHQTFVPGRAGMWQDWLIDTAGVLLGTLVVLKFVWRKDIFELAKSVKKSNSKIKKLLTNTPAFDTMSDTEVNNDVR